MSHPQNDKLIDNQRDSQTSIMEDLEEMQFLIQSLAVWSDRTLSLKEAQKRINDLKIKFAIPNN